ncbi:putative ankyrin repeat-containing domain protein [Rosellinia necatrix]|uniref:Putative ankyrin repeat-containing domain protein n=1 Tax=Rosellinia necatrix TaxID=77044 RepID=A0A1S8ABB5_ROSNE|nr:putative ankyrin repeat-containing domain protein [Rosellinia necatrix]
MSPQRPRLSNQQWNDRKASIRQWYLVDDESLEQVQSKLKQQGLDATIHQIEHKLKTWNFRKYVDKKTWISIDHRITKRKRDGKESEVIFYGRRMKTKTVAKETDRHGDRSTLARLGLRRNPSPPPLADCHVAVCTPQPLQMEFEWPPSLPWLRFSSRELPMIHKVCKPLILESQNAPSRGLVSAILPAVPRIDIAHIGVSKLAAIIGRSMPETYPEENLQRAQTLLGESAEDSLREYVSIIIYTVSNNMHYLYHSYQWKRIFEVLQDAGIFRLSVNLRANNSPTMNGFMEKFHNISILRYVRTIYNQPRDAQVETALKWLVASGYCPNTTAKALWTRVQHYSNVPLHTQQSMVDLTKYLLNAGASADILVTGGNVIQATRHEKPQTILEIALQRHWESDTIIDLAELLLKHGASKSLYRSLHTAIRSKWTGLVEILTQLEGSLTASLEPSHNSSPHRETALTVAASVGLEQATHILNQLSSRYPSIHVSTFITPDVFMVAAAGGHDEIIRYMHKFSHSIIADEYGITPLHMAARFGHLSTCQLLLALQSASNTHTSAKVSPLHAACHGGHQSVVEFLITKGADVNAAPIFDSEDEVTRFSLWFGEQICPLLFAYDPFFVYYPFSKAVLDWLLSCPLDPGRLSCAAILVSSGAKLVGSELSIAAECRHLKLLSASIAAGADPNVLDAGGKTALQHALRGGRREFDSLYSVISYLLSKGARLLGGEVDSAVSLKDWEVVTLLQEHGGNVTKTEYRNELEKAVLRRDNALVVELFYIQPRIYSAGALHAAIEMGNNSMIQSLMSNRPADTSGDRFEITAIAAAATFGNLALLQTLLAHPPSCHTGPLPFVRDHSSGRLAFLGIKYQLNQRGSPYEWPRGSPLALVAISMHSDALKACSQLLRSGFCADKLTWVVASSFNNTAFVEALLCHTQHGDYSYGEFLGFHPLACAIRNDNETLIDLLLTARVDANGRGTCVGEPLHAAVKKGDLNIVRKLVQAGADVNAASLFTMSPLRQAVQDGRLDIVDYLVQAGADLNKASGSPEQVPLQEAVRKERLDIVDYLVRAGADVNAASLATASLLLPAVQQGRLDIVDYLVRAGADVNSPAADVAGATYLQMAAINGDLGLARYLIDEGAQVNAPPSRYRGRTALQGAAEHGRLDMLEFLLVAGALTNDRWRRRFIKAVKLAIKERHSVVADILKQRAGWSDEDQELLLQVNVDYDTGSEGDE